MQAFDVPFCRQHPQLLANYYYLEQPARRVCVLCKLPNSSFLFTTYALSNMMRSTAMGVSEGENAALSRHQALSLLAQRVRGEYGREDQDLIREMMKRIQVENRKYKQVKTRIDLMKNRLGGLQKIMKYFESLREGDLYQIKMNLSSEEGMKKFYKKCRNYAALINKGVHNQFKKLECKLSQDYSLLQKLEEQSLLHRLQGIIDKRNVQLAKRQHGNNQKDPKIQLGC